MRRFLLAVALSAISLSGPASAESGLKLVDAHMHYSHEAWDFLPTDQAIEVLRKAGLKRAMVSSSSDEGTQRLYKAAPDLIVPVLRPYRMRGETGSWFRDETVPAMLAELLDKNVYAGIGEFHIFGPDADGSVMRQVVQLAKKHKIFLHAHSDADAVHRLFAQYPDARILWAHSGFDQPAEVAQMLKTYPNLWADLAFRSEHASDDKVMADWRRLFEAFPDRFMLGTDTYTPERWHYVEEHADWSRAWLNDLPQELRLNIAHRNAEKLIAWALPGN